MVNDIIFEFCEGNLSFFVVDSDEEYIDFDEKTIFVDMSVEDDLLYKRLFDYIVRAFIFANLGDAETIPLSCITAMLASKIVRIEEIVDRIFYKLEGSDLYE